MSQAQAGIPDEHLHHSAHGHSHSASHAPRPWSRIRALFRPERKDIGVIFVYAMFVALLSLATPIAVEAMVSTVMFGVVVWPIIWLALILFICMALAGTIHMVEAWVIEILNRRLFIRTVAEFAQILPKVKLEAFDQEYGPNAVNRFFDILKVQKSAATLLLDGIGMALATLVGMAVLAVYHPILLAFDLGLICSFAVIILMGRGGVRTGIEESTQKYEMAAWLQELGRLPRSFKTGYGPALALRRADEIATLWLRERREHFAVIHRQFITGIVVQVFASVALLGIGGWLVMQRQLTSGQLIAAELIISLVVGSLLKLNKYLEAWYGLCVGVEKLAHVTELPQERTTGEPLGEPHAGMKLAVSDVGYQGTRSVWNGISWTVNANEKVALTGTAGIGKSLFLEVISGLREPTSGHIELDDYDLRDLQLDSVRRQVAIISGIEIFSGTISDNLKMGREHLSMGELRDALQAVYLQGTIQALPDGLMTQLSPSGLPLSPSQALRLCLARAIVGRPRLLILDGILDQLDLNDLPELMDTLFGSNAPWTLLVVTRSEEVMSRCDRVVVVPQF